VELADALVVNKADAAAETLAETARQHYENALALLRHEDSWTAAGADLLGAANGVISTASGK
jgi:putative protein kinase ArgK-like GTPase of G3E family